MRRLCILAILFLSVTMAFAHRDKVTTDTSVLPAASRQFLTEHFATIAVSHIQVEKMMMVFTEEYNVILTDGTNVEFDRKGNWKEVKRHKSAVPSALVPAQIQKFIRQKYPSATVVAISKDSRDYEVKLDNGTELKFNLKGKLIEID